MRTIFFLIIGLVICVGTSEVLAQEIHNQCGSCHKMHTGTVGSTRHLIDYGANPSDMCLNCHDYTLAGGTDLKAPVVSRAVSNGRPELPAGDFERCGAGNEGKGHNVEGSTVIPVDPVNGQTAPGGNGAAIADFTCLACHYPHLNKAYNFRLLRKVIPDIGGGATFDTAGTLTDTDAGNTTAGTQEANLWDNPGGNQVIDNGNKNVYRRDLDANGWGGWCGGCHTNYHPGTFLDVARGYEKHPTNLALNANQAGNAEGQQKIGTAYDFALPADLKGNAAVTWNAAAGNYAAVDRVFCLSCHKAHASAPSATADNITRWDVNAAQGAGVGCNQCHNKG